MVREKIARRGQVGLAPGVRVFSPPSQRCHFTRYFTLPIPSRTETRLASSTSLLS